MPHLFSLYFTSFWILHFHIFTSLHLYIFTSFAFLNFFILNFSLLSFLLRKATSACLFVHMSVCSLNCKFQQIIYIYMCILFIQNTKNNCFMSFSKSFCTYIATNLYIIISMVILFSMPWF